MGLLVSASIWAIFVAATLWFPTRRGPLGFVVYLATMSFNEIPMVLLVVFGMSAGLTLTDESADTAVAGAVSLYGYLGAGRRLVRRDLTPRGRYRGTSRGSASRRIPRGGTPSRPGSPA